MEELKDRKKFNIVEITANLSDIEYERFIKYEEDKWVKKCGSFHDGDGKRALALLLAGVADREKVLSGFVKKDKKLIEYYERRYTEKEFDDDLSNKTFEEVPKKEIEAVEKILKDDKGDLIYKSPLSAKGRFAVARLLVAESDREEILQSLTKEEADVVKYTEEKIKRLEEKKLKKEEKEFARGEESQLEMRHEEKNAHPLGHQPL